MCANYGQDDMYNWKTNIGDFGGVCVHFDPCSLITNKFLQQERDSAQTSDNKSRRVEH